MRARLLIAFALLTSASLEAASRRVLFVTHSAGFRHGSIETATAVLAEIGRESGRFDLTATEDLRQINAGNLASYDAVLFFTSGELNIDNSQKAALLAYVRSGKGFGGFHSATDTLYGWPEYGEMIGGYFDGHPWTQEASIDVEEPEHPVVANLAPAFRIVEEFYQFRSFSRERVRVLMTLDTTSVDMRAPGINRTDEDFALAWVRSYGEGRVFYSALGHFDDTWKDPRIRTMLLSAVLWLTGEADAPAAPRHAAPRVSELRTLAGDATHEIAPGALVSIDGEGLTTGSSGNGSGQRLPAKLAGSAVIVNGAAASLFSVAPDRIVVQVPYSIAPGRAEMVVVSGSTARSEARQLLVAEATPRILAAVGDRAAGWLTLYATGLGKVEPEVTTGTPAPLSPLATNANHVGAVVDGRSVRVLFAGLAPTLIGVYQINAELPAEVGNGRLAVTIETGGRTSPPFPFE